ncbi:SMC [Hepatospora eriocheir]|uniref:SMC n=1 Tax=Hepatospora eriocheir TaxID=1081669 RepID=A0A1X0QDI0_9MICR|nr:SMC [Hepatospora eriocheir]
MQTVTEEVDKGGSLYKIDLLNFKSYGDKYSIGPFDNFTCIIGPNGSGKSNILDAITFALGIESSSIRVSSARHVISNGKNKTEVKLVFKKNNGEFLEMCRALDISGRSVYSIDSQIVSLKRYNKIIESFNIFPKIKNFVIYQGMILNPEVNLVGIIETISGSINYKEMYENLQQNLQVCNKELSQKLDFKKDIMNDIKEMENIKERESKFVELMKEKELLNKSLYCIEINQIMEKNKVIDFELGTLRSKLDQITKNENFINQRIEIKTLKKEISLKQKELYESNAEIDYQKKCKLNFKEKLTEIKKNEEELKRLQLEQKSLPSKIVYPTEIDFLSNNENLKNSNMLERYYSKVKEGEIKAPEEHFENQLAILLSYYTEQVAKDERLLCKLTVEDFDVIAKRNLMEIEFKKLNAIKNNIKKEYQGKVDRNKQRELKIKELEVKIKQVNIPENESIIFQTIETELNQLQERLTKLTRELLFCQGRKQTKKNNILIANTIQTLKSLFPGVIGKVSDLIEPTQKKYDLAISALIHKYESSVVVNDVATALNCVQYLKNSKLCKLSFLVLEKINKKNYFSGVENFVTLKEDLGENFINFIFRRSNIVETVEEAKRSIYHSNEYSSIATLNGILFQSSGLVTGGNINKFEESQVEQLIKERKSILTKIKDIRNRKEGYKKVENQVLECRDMKSEIEKIKSGFENLEEVKFEDENRLNELRNEISQINEKLKVFEREKQRTKESIKAKEMDILGSILNSVGCYSLEEYRNKKESIIRRGNIELEIETEISALKGNLNDNRIIDIDIVGLTSELDTLKLRLKKINITFSSMNLRMEELNSKISNYEILKTKLDEDLKEKLKYCFVETNLKDEKDIEEFYKTIKNKSVDICKKKLMEVTKMLISNAPSNVSHDNSLQAKYLKFTREYEQCKESAVLAREHFNEIKKQRLSTFKEVFELLQKEISKVYKKLSYNEFNEEENTSEVAYVVAEGDPFTIKNSVKFYVMPPGKGFIEFKALSGGEKSMALLSFIFALNNIKKPAFYVFDEIDQALDRENVDKLASYLIEEQKRCQYIIISLKSQLFEHANSLIGVYKDPNDNQSKILTYRLKTH